MSTYLKFILIAALFITTGAASVFGQSQESSPSTTDQKTVEQTTNKEVKKSSESSTEKSSESSSDSSGSQTTDNNIATAESEPAVQSSSESSATNSTEESTTKQPAAAEVTTESSDVNSRPAATVNAAEPANQSAPAPETQNAAKPEPAAMQADQMKINGQLISYSNAGQGSGQGIIDANPNQVATWGGASVQSGNDGSNTHFIGHNPGIFNVLFSLGNGAAIDVSDSSNNVTSYTVSQIVTVDDSGMAADGTDYWDQITGSGGGERITLQTCINDDYNLIVFASK